ncbi:TPA_asm: hypothetical protein [ssRNA phage Gephyllon.4_9]|uniref:Uncharacterized protein n=1 Tax=ssRNA phage Gephyllon.4_9 TaxID=2786189 RepID=A0A8S5L1K5_9VIRU|nr:hypothetical protein QIN75_gp3 [ssRNA phage Gephyllon.4_9]DAD51363.1 TPA_asm: hypothetical protein [ssRNA phage Gephyllon.4_9]
MLIVGTSAMIIVAGVLVTIVALTIIYLTLSYKHLLVIRDLLTSVPRVRSSIARHSKVTQEVEDTASHG